MAKERLTAEGHDKLLREALNALAFYALAENWEPSYLPPDIQVNSLCDRDRGARARAILRQQAPCQDEDCFYPRGHRPPHSHQEHGV